jgi:hypothetical protein
MSGELLASAGFMMFVLTRLMQSVKLAKRSY